MLFIAYILILLIVALPLPGPNRPFRRRHGRANVAPLQPLRPTRVHTPDPTAGLRDPARLF